MKHYRRSTDMRSTDRERLREHDPLAKAPGRLTAREMLRRLDAKLAELEPGNKMRRFGRLSIGRGTGLTTRKDT